MTQNEPFHFQTRIRFIDTDASGRIHNTALLRYFEAAETEFLRTLGFTYQGQYEYGFPRVHVECDFLSWLALDDLIEIEVYLTKIGTSSVRWEFRTTTNGVLAATGAVIAVCVHRDTKKSTPIPAELRSVLEAVVNRRDTMQA